MEPTDHSNGPTYAVHLRSETTGLDSPLETNRIDFFDAGIWVFRSDERLFLPYHQVELIREQRADGEETDPSSQ